MQLEVESFDRLPVLGFESIDQPFLERFELCHDLVRDPLCGARTELTSDERKELEDVTDVVVGERRNAKPFVWSQLDETFGPE
jgi:hypothetical protein